MRDNTNGALALGGCLPILLWLFFIGCWIGNIVKLLSCDFDAPYTEEVIYGIGVVVGPAAVVTVWL